MTKSPPSKLSSRRLALLTITDHYPVAMCSTNQCPLCRLASLPRPKRQAWLNALNLAELEYLAAYHSVCLELSDAVRAPHAPRSFGVRR